MNQQHLDPVTLIGHSLGGAITLQYAGVFANKVQKLIAIEGLGPRRDEIRKTANTAVSQRMTKWIARIRSLAGRVPRQYETIDDAVQRMREANTRLSEAQARHPAIHDTNQNEDGTYSWKYDPYTLGHSPYRFNAGEAKELWGQITSPTILVGGGES